MILVPLLLMRGAPFMVGHCYSKHSLHLGETIDVFSPPTECIALSGTMITSKQGRSFQLSFE